MCFINKPRKLICNSGDNWITEWASGIWSSGDSQFDSGDSCSKLHVWLTRCSCITSIIFSNSVSYCLVTGAELSSIIWAIHSIKTNWKSSSGNLHFLLYMFKILIPSPILTFFYITLCLRCTFQQGMDWV